MVHSLRTVKPERFRKTPIGRKLFDFHEIFPYRYRLKPFGFLTIIGENTTRTRMILNSEKYLIIFEEICI